MQRQGWVPLSRAHDQPRRLHGHAGLGRVSGHTALSRRRARRTFCAWAPPRSCERSRRCSRCSRTRSWCSCFGRHRTPITCTCCCSSASAASRDALRRRQSSYGPALAGEHVRFYTSVLVLVLEHLHAKGFVYRDLKPDNVLLGERGYPLSATWHGGAWAAAAVRRRRARGVCQPEQLEGRDGHRTSPSPAPQPEPQPQPHPQPQPEP